MSNSVNDNNGEMAAFVNAIEDSKFEIKDVNEEIIVVEDTSLEEGYYGKYIEIPLEELKKPLNQLMDVLYLRRKDVCLDGITRIVGYYSRVTNWNKSKVGELRDRGFGVYKLGKGNTGSKDRQKAIDCVTA